MWVNWFTKNAFVGYILVPDSRSISMSADTIDIGQRLKAIPRSLIRNIRKWGAACRRAIILCKSIERCKSLATHQFSGHKTKSLQSIYPAEPISCWEKLSVLIYSDIRRPPQKWTQKYKPNWEHQIYLSY